MEQDRITQLLDKYAQGRCSPAEQALVERWYAQRAAELPDPIVSHDPVTQRADSWEVVRRHTGIPVRRLRWWPYAAAVIILALGVGFLFWNQGSRGGEHALAASDIQPGSNRATLTLANGSTIDLSEAQTGIVVGDGITYLDGSAVVGEQVSMGTSEPVTGAERNRELTSSQVHTLTTPKGGTYQVTLPDGSRVWLNAGSTLKYPSRFSGDERVVELTGEAYFDVSEQMSKVTSEHGAVISPSQAHQLTSSQVHKFTSPQKIPFKVISNGQTVDVLGTEFNIHAYADDAEIVTTLVEGAVQVVNLASSSVDRLSPGEQSIVNKATTTTRQVDVAPYTAWRNGIFHFAGDLEHIMAQVGRWYDVAIVFGDESLKTEEILGVVNRYEPLSAVLDILEQVSGATFTVTAHGTERRVTVMR